MFSHSAFSLNNTIDECLVRLSQTEIFALWFAIRRANAPMRLLHIGTALTLCIQFQIELIRLRRAMDPQNVSSLS